MISTKTHFKGVKRLENLQQFIWLTSRNFWTLCEHKLADPVELTFKIAYPLQLRRKVIQVESLIDRPASVLFPIQQSLTLLCCHNSRVSRTVLTVYAYRNVERSILGATGFGI
jgi:hypothetical protein